MAGNVGQSSANYLHEPTAPPPSAPFGGVDVVRQGYDEAELWAYYLGFYGANTGVEAQFTPHSIDDDLPTHPYSDETYPPPLYGPDGQEIHLYEHEDERGIPMPGGPPVPVEPLVPQPPEPLTPFEELLQRPRTPRPEPTPFEELLDRPRNVPPEPLTPFEELLQRPRTPMPEPTELLPAAGLAAGVAGLVGTIAMLFPSSTASDDMLYPKGGGSGSPTVGQAPEPVPGEGLPEPRTLADRLPPTPPPPAPYEMLGYAGDLYAPTPPTLPQLLGEDGGASKRTTTRRTSGVARAPIPAPWVNVVRDPFRGSQTPFSGPSTLAGPIPRSDTPGLPLPEPGPEPFPQPEPLPPPLPPPELGPPTQGPPLTDFNPQVLPSPSPSAPTPDERCNCESRKHAPDPSDKVPTVQSYKRRMSNWSLRNLRRGAQ